MHVKVRKAGEVVILDLDEKLVAGTPQQMVREVFDELFEQGWTKILVNLSAVESIDSSGIGELVAAYKNATRLGASVRLLQAQGRVHKALQISQILPLFSVYDDEAVAIAEFA